MHMWARSIEELGVSRFGDKTLQLVTWTSYATRVIGCKQCTKMPIGGPVSQLEEVASCRPGFDPLAGRIWWAEVVQFICALKKKSPRPSHSKEQV